GFAAFFVCLDRSAAEGGETWWPLLTVRVAGLSAVLVAILVFDGVRQSGSISARLDGVGGWPRLRTRTNPAPAAVVPLFLIAGLGDQGGNVFFLCANQNDVLSV